MDQAMKEIEQMHSLKNQKHFKRDRSQSPVFSKKENIKVCRNIFQECPSSGNTPYSNKLFEQISYKLIEIHELNMAKHVILLSEGENLISLIK